MSLCLHQLLYLKPSVDRLDTRFLYAVTLKPVHVKKLLLELQFVATFCSAWTLSLYLARFDDVGLQRIR